MRNKPLIVSIALLIYIAFMAIIGWDDYSQKGDMWQYWSILVASLIIVFALNRVMVIRNKKRREWRKEREASGRRSYRNDNIF